MATSLAQHHGISQGGASRGDMHRGTASEVKSTHLVRPSIGVPGPAGDGVIDDSGPHEDEDDAGEHSAALGDGAGRKGHGQGGEHALVDGEEHVRYMGRTDRRPGQDIAEAKVCQVTNEGPGRV